MRQLILAVVSGVSATLAFGAVTNITEDVRLDADADWRGQGVVKLAEGVTIVVKLGDRKPRRGDCLVSWDETHAPQNVTFEIDAASKAYGYDVEAREDGLYFLNNCGACILIK